MMQIVFIGCRDIDKRVGGIESYMKSLLEVLKRRDDVEAILYEGSDVDEKRIDKNITYIKFKVTSNKYLNKLLIGKVSTRRAMKEYPNADIYHYNANIAGLFSYIPLRKNKKVVFEGHGFEWKRAKWNPIIRKLNKMVDDFVLGRNKNILMCSQEQVDYVNENYPGKHIMAAPTGVDL
ncbi:glycosyltransferase family 4 protein [uncultured Treponema sp.]|uniref:glycosyltransferase family 4 protein n=1 Tax=uncultured Treponema sp. TaxID=162155 RepID=UPI0025911192|nr:glycosyltransferase family 4 protein [uncultured Treponema sp.]